MLIISVTFFNQLLNVLTHILPFNCQIVMEFCGAGSVSDLMKIRNKTVSESV